MRSWRQMVPEGKDPTRRRWMQQAAALWGTHRLLGAQEQATFSTDVKVVNVFATVHGKSGAMIRDLGKEDFTLIENGRPQNIRYFSRETDLPLTIGLLIDTSGSQEKVLDA